MSKVVIVGGGAAGMMAGVYAGKRTPGSHTGKK